MSEFADISSALSGWCAAFRQPPEMTLSQWADEYAYLSPENCAEPGRWTTRSYQKGILDACTDPSIERISIKKSARVGYTKLIDHVIGYHVHLDPCPMLCVQPTVEDAEGYSRDEVVLMFRDTPVLAAIVPQGRSRNSNSTILKKRFPGGVLYLVGSNSPRGFRRITVRIVLLDEIDGYDPVAGKEGDQIALATMRTQTYWNRKIIAGSTPTLEGASRIADLYEASDKRKFFVPCPTCGHFHVLEWDNMRWPEGEPHKAHFVCPENGCVIEDQQKPAMVDAGEWRAERPFYGHAGFWIWTAYSTNTNAAWGKLATEFIEAKRDPAKHQVFRNTVQGLEWRDAQSSPSTVEKLMARRGVWGDRLPAQIVCLTAGVDVQDNRVEMEIVGWGRDEQSWSIAYLVLPGDLTQPAVWQNLEQQLTRAWTHSRLLPDMQISAACIDTGGHHTDAVYNFCRTRHDRRVWAIKGMPGPLPAWPRKPSYKNKAKIPLYLVGVDSIKETLFARMKLDELGPGYCSFPTERGQDYFEQLLSEVQKFSTVNGKSVRSFELKRPGMRNEALDCRVYATAALSGLKMLGLNINMAADNLETVAYRPETPSARTEAPQPAMMPTAAGRRVRSRGL